MEAVAIKDGVIIYVGSDVGVDAFINNDTRVEDMQGNFVMPGIHDVHMHPLEASSPIGGTCALNGNTEDITVLVNQLAACNLGPNSNGWITAFGYSMFALISENLTKSPREYLDDIFPNTPVVVMEQTSHSMWVNSKALQMAGITANTLDPNGGHIVKFEGELQGILLDNAGDIVISMALANNATIEELNYQGLINYGLPKLAENGITSFCEGRTYWKRNYHIIWKRIHGEGKLTARVMLNFWAYPDDNLPTLINDIRALKFTGDNMLRGDQVKVYSDGITINATAALHEDYVAPHLGWPFNKGLNYFTQANLTTLITGLETEGFDFHIHAIGDLGISESVNAIVAARVTNNDNTVRHRITHLEIVRQTDIDKFDDYNITADMQVAGDFTQPNHWHDVDFLVGTSRANDVVPLKKFYDAGARVVLSSDWDVSALNPFVGMQNSLTRAPQNLPTLASTIKAYTIDAAYVMRQEDKVGSIEVGKLADMIVLDQNLTTISNTAINATNVLLTMVGGKIVYRACNNQNLNIGGTISQDSIYKTTGSIVSNATISSGKHIEMLAEEKVELQENFETPQTSTLYVNMEECREKVPD